jgi:mRNA-degrading endonuclease RelE of RelBE toxin-antitoxin system
MSNNTSFVQIDLTPEYKRNLRELSKKYRNIRLDTQSIIEQFQGGNFIGDRLAGMGENYVIIVLFTRTAKL